MKKIVSAGITLLVYMTAHAQAVGTKVTFKAADGKTYTGTVEEVKTTYKIKYDGVNFESYLTKDQFTILPGAPQAPAAGTPGKVMVDADNTLSADRPITTCPVQQTAVKNGAKPNPELFKKLIQCAFGEKPANKGMDGAEMVDITSIQVGAPRKWDYLKDLGQGSAATIVYPVKTVATSKTFYRTRTVEVPWSRVINIYVNTFGEWAVGSAESVTMGEARMIERK